MNDARRKRIEKIRDQLDALKTEIEDVQQEERDYFENMPENMQGSERGEKAEASADALQEACDQVESAMDSLGTATE